MTLVTVETPIGEVHKNSAGLPSFDGPAFPFTLFKLEGDRFLLDTRAPAGQSSTRFYLWSPGEGWATAASHLSCAADGVLMGTSGGEPIIVDPASHNLCAKNIAALR